MPDDQSKWAEEPIGSSADWDTSDRLTAAIMEIAQEDGNAELLEFASSAEAREAIVEVMAGMRFGSLSARATLGPAYMAGLISQEDMSVLVRSHRNQAAQEALIFGGMRAMIRQAGAEPVEPAQHEWPERPNESEAPAGE